MKTPSRRQFLAASALVAATPAVRAIDAFARSGPARLNLSLAAYSFRDHFRDQPNGRPGSKSANRAMDLPGFIDFCAANGCAGAELTAYYFPADVGHEFLLGVRRHAFLRGVSVSGTAIGNTYTHPKGEKRDREIALTKLWIRNAQVLGAPHIRVFAGNLEGQTEAVARRNCIEALEECADAAGKAGVFLGIENHGGIVAEAGQLLSIIREVRSPWVGINLDSGNFHSADPYADIARCAPFAVNVQVKVEIRRQGGGNEASDLSRLAKILRDSGYQGWVALEYESAPDAFEAVPRHLKELGAALAIRG